MSGEMQISKRGGASGLVFVGCLMLALAVGILIGNFAVAVLGGLGIGFIGIALVRIGTGEW